MLTGLLFALAGCLGSSGEGYDYRNIEPVYFVRNAPIPVPWPRDKPGTPPTAQTSRPPAQDQVVSAGRNVTVKRGDTLYSLAKAAGVELRALIDLNELSAPYRLRIGQELRLPAMLTHTVARGETSYSISRRYGVDLTRLVRANNMRPPFTLRVGQALKIPGNGQAATASITGRSAGGNVRRSMPASLPPRQGSSFLWPVEGRLLSGFGPKDGGIQNDGINIRARAGTPVRAADAGVVAYAGSGIRGFGNLLLVRHAGGWVTAYAHNADLLVARGDQVNRGQPIARVGATGAVSSPQLHFEVRKGARAVNPVQHLARQ